MFRDGTYFQFGIKNRILNIIDKRSIRYNDFFELSLNRLIIVEGFYSVQHIAEDTFAKFYKDIPNGLLIMLAFSKHKYFFWDVTNKELKVFEDHKKIRVLKHFKM